MPNQRTSRVPGPSCMAHVALSNWIPNGSNPITSRDVRTYTQISQNISPVPKSKSGGRGRASQFPIFSSTCSYFIGIPHIFSDEATEMIGFIQGEIAGEKLVAGDVFPKTLMPAAASGGDLANLVLEEREHLFADLRRHRALLFRGFDVSDAGDFHRAVEAFRWEAIEMKSSASTRTKITSRVYSANEAPPEQLINFHHEMPLMTEMPRMLFFCCGEPSPQGGETAIVASDVVVQRMDERMPEVMAKVAEVGLVFSIKTASDAEAADSETVVNRTWKSLLGTDDETEAEKRLLEMHESCSSVKFLSNGSAELVFGPTNPVREFSGRRAWIYPILGFAGDRRSVKNEFGDGSDFPAEALDVYRRILEENCVDVNWQKGDVLLLDNLAVQHARRPGKPPRRILASLCK
ncbi:Clavaminate synthase-like protein [Apostasia shenzhenica]|uniref:Clavaminate synthase-like protein n=1 Tax=Apostasia shenzhenica TaxID=1088818 RepID=A0A2I0AKJ8_9ASPA|nr:Clavaminate synthase-like protein [Apostasia shenzhenica]